MSTLLRGVGIVIDDHANDLNLSNDKIGKIIEQIQQASIPIVIYNELPPESVFRHWNNVAFILLDWELLRKKQRTEEAVEMETPVNLGEELKSVALQLNIDFLKNLKKVCFAPIFIFSHLDHKQITERLIKEKLLCEQDGQNYIFVHSKDDLIKTPTGVIDAVDKWIRSTPSIYLFNQWKTALSESQTQMFIDFYGKDFSWPSVLWDAYKQDKDDPSHALGNLLLRNIQTRILPLSLDSKCVKPRGSPKSDKGTIRSVLEATTCISDSSLSKTQFGCGDLFKGSGKNKDKYFLNIRCDCDCVVRKKAADKRASPVELYVITGSRITETKLSSPDSKVFSEKYGLVPARECAFVFPIDGGKCLRFDFSDLERMTLRMLKNRGFSRIGRLVAPYITDVRQRYAQWLQREGFPKIPILAVRDCVVRPTER